MSDYNLTPGQWKMARQAGAAFTPDIDEQVGINVGEQLALDGLGPQPGELFKNVHTGIIGCVVHTETRRQGWVTIRHANRQTTIPLRWIGEHWLPCRPDGSLK